MWIRARGGGQPMWIVFTFYNIILKSANVDKGGGGGKTLIHKMWIRRHVFFYPSLIINPYLKMTATHSGPVGEKFDLTLTQS